MGRHLSSSTRVSRIVRFLDSHRSDKANTLRLEIEDGEEGKTAAGTWERNAEFDSETVAGEVDALIQNQADEEGSKVRGKLVWLTPDDRQWSSFALIAQPEGGGITFDGTTRQSLVQNQRHMEAMAMNYIKGTAGVIEDMKGLLSEVRGILTESNERARFREEEVARLRDENAQLSLRAERAEEGANNAAEVAEEAVKTVEDLKREGTADAEVLKLVTKAFTSGDRPKKQPKTNVSGSGAPSDPPIESSEA